MPDRELELLERGLVRAGGLARQAWETLRDSCLAKRAAGSPIDALVAEGIVPAELGKTLRMAAKGYITTPPEVLLADVLESERLRPLRVATGAAAPEADLARGPTITPPADPTGDSGDSGDSGDPGDPGDLGDTDDTPESALSEGAVLYYERNYRSARLAIAGLQLAGYTVHYARTPEKCFALYNAHGEDGDGTLVALLLDASDDPHPAALLARALHPRRLVTSYLPRIVLFDRTLPQPLSGEEGRIHYLRRPFATPALVSLLQRSTGGASA